MTQIQEPIYLLPQDQASLSAAPTAVLNNALIHIAAVKEGLFAGVDEKRQTLYLAALSELASTYDEADAPALYETYENMLPSGIDLNAASPSELRRYTLALHGLARDRDLHGPAARSLDVWLAAADEALATYQRQPLPAAA